MHDISSNDRRARTGAAKRLLPALALAVGATLTSTPTAAWAAATGSNTATVSVDVIVRSITVTPANSTFGGCGANGTQLVVPGGSCTVGNGSVGSGGITITNGSVAGHIDINGDDAVPSDDGTEWTLGPTAGADTFIESSSSESGEVDLSMTPACDTAFAADASCAASAGQGQIEYPTIGAPTSSTDTSSTFTITTTWTAVP